MLFIGYYYQNSLLTPLQFTLFLILMYHSSSISCREDNLILLL